MSKMKSRPTIRRGGRSTNPSPSLPNAGQPITVAETVRLQAVAIPEADGRYSVAIPALRGCVAEGRTIEEVHANVVDAAEGWLVVSHEKNRERCVEQMRG
jgi:predicted RNase H-like HicB family nuclease